MDNNVSKIVEKFLDSLEKKVLDLHLQVENYKAKNIEYDELGYIINLLHESKINFAVEYLNQDTKKFASILEKYITDKNKLNYYLSEMTNYYYLYETNLLDNEATKEQTNQSEQALNELEDELKNIQSSIDVTRNRNIIKEIEMLEEKIVLFGSKISYIKDLDEPVELDLFVELMEGSRLAEEEKISLLQLVIKCNNKIYENKLKEKNSNVIKEFEKNQIEVLESLEELTPKSIVTTIDKETLERIEVLLSNPDTIKKLVKIIAEEEDFHINIDGQSIYAEEQEIIEETKEIAKESLIELLTSEKAQTPEEALAIFIETNDNDLYDAEVLYETIFGEMEKENEDISIDEYLEMIQLGIEFFDHNKKLLKDMPEQDKETIDNFSKDLYRSKGNRIIVYKSKAFDGNSKPILKDATYEIGILLKMFEKIENANRLTNEIIINVGKRINEILESVKEATKDFKETIEEPTKDIQKQKGTIYFLEKGTEKDRTIYEEEIGLGNYNKGISNSYYKDLLLQLEQIENRGQRNIPAVRPLNSKFYHYTSNFGVRVISSSRISTYFIPVGTDDAIIVGARFIDTGDGYGKALEQRLKTHAIRIEELIEKVKVNKDKEQAKAYLKEIKRMLSNDEKHKEETDEVEEMFKVQPVEIKSPKHM